VGADDVMSCSLFSVHACSSSTGPTHNPPSFPVSYLIYLFRSAMLVAQTIIGSIRFHAVSGGIITQLT
jgi:hypothetical protein